MSAPEVDMRRIVDATEGSRRNVTRRALRENWLFREERCRGGRRRLYLVASLPADVREALGDRPEPEQNQNHTQTKRGKGAPRCPKTPTSSSTRTRTREAPPAPVVDPAVEADLQSHFERLTAARRAECEALVPVLDRACALAGPKVSMRAALERAVGEAEDCPRRPRTLYAAWLGRRGRPGLRTLPRRLWAAALAPRHAGCVAFAECDQAAWEAFKADFLRAEQPTAAHSHRLVVRLAESKGWTVPRTAATFLRRLRREVPVEALVLARQGPEAVARLRPAQVRDRTALRSMEGVSADGHRFDQFVRWPDGRRKRPMLVAWHDMRSGEVLGWDLGPEETADAYRRSFGMVLRDHGIPQEVVVDNGRGIASHLMTGQTPNRYRNAYREDEPLGLLTRLVGKDRIHWTTPYHGQSKPIERAFRDLAMDIARDVRLSGSYAGSSTERKPHNYSSQAAVPLERFRQVVADGIRQHNARRGRRGMGMHGRSCDEVFREHLDPAMVPQPTEAQLEQWMLVPKLVTARSSDGSVAVGERRWWHADLARALAGRSAARRRVVVRWDPDDLERPAMVETPDGRLLARAELQTARPVFGKSAAEETARDRARLQKAAREQLEVHRTLSTPGLAALVDEVAGTGADAAPAPEAAPEPKESKIITGAFGMEPESEPKESPADVLILDALRAVSGGSL